MPSGHSRGFRSLLSRWRMCDGLLGRYTRPKGEKRPEDSHDLYTTTLLSNSTTVAADWVKTRLGIYPEPLCYWHDPTVGTSHRLCGSGSSTCSPLNGGWGSRQRSSRIKRKTLSRDAEVISCSLKTCLAFARRCPVEGRTLSRRKDIGDCHSTIIFHRFECCLCGFVDDVSSMSSQQSV